MCRCVYLHYYVHEYPQRVLNTKYMCIDVWKLQSQKAQTLLQIAVDLGNPACVQPGRDDKVFPVLSIPKDTSVTE